MQTISNFYRTVEKRLDLNRFPKAEIKKAGLALINEHWYYGVIYDPNHNQRVTWIPYLSGKNSELPSLSVDTQGHYNPSQIRTLLGIGEVWNKQEFQYPRQPVPIAKVLNTYAFQAPMPNVVDLPIKMKGDSTIYLPYEYRGMGETIAKIIDCDKQINPHFDDYYAYLTVDKRPVKAGNSQRRYGCHVDGFQSDLVEPKVRTRHCYVVSDTLGTEFITDGFEIKNIGDTVNDWYESFQHQSEHMERVKAQPFEINLFDAYQVHTSTVATEDTERTLARVSFSVRQLNRIGNGINPLIKEEWKYQPVTIGNQPVT